MNPRRETMAFFPWLIWLALGLSASCTPYSAQPEERFYRLPPPTAENFSRCFDRLAVAPLQAQGLYYERAVLWGDSNDPLVLHRSRYDFWQQAPADMISAHLLTWLRDSGVAQQVMERQRGRDYDAVVSGRLLRFERVLDANGASSLAAMELRLDVEGKAVVAEAYAAQVRAADTSVSAAARAFGAALRQIYASFLNDFLRNEASGPCVRSSGRD